MLTSPFSWSALSYYIHTHVRALLDITLCILPYLTGHMYIYIRDVCVCNNRPRYSGAKQPATSHGPATETPRVGAETRLDWTDVYFCFLFIEMFDVYIFSIFTIFDISG